MSDRRWWESGVVYQVYPRSFMDSDGDGVGDLNGITGKLDYLSDLGVDAVWMSPIFPSPMADFGYDVSDYTDIHPMFGTLEDFDALVEKAHSHGMKVILDYVPNHSSDEHEWFAESRSSRDNPKRDWYVWRDAKPDGSAPNNWLSEFGGPGWTWDDATEQFYYHAYHPKQPDLNWRNPEVVQAMMDVLRFWLARGVDGFRVDAVNHLMEDESFADNPENPDWREGDEPRTALLQTNTAGHPDSHEQIAVMRKTVEEYDGRFIIGEIYQPIDVMMQYYGTDSEGFHAPTNMYLVELKPEERNARDIAAYVEDYEAALPEGAWPNWVLGNHDRPRLASRVRSEEQARLFAMLLLTLRGTPTVYYGDEIAMTDGEIPPELEQDPVAKTSPGFGRDPVRTPMQWDATDKAGFTSGEPWIPVSPDRDKKNVATQEADPHSVLNLHRELIALRRREAALSVGSYRTLSTEGNVLVYEREDGGSRFVVALNFDAEEKSIELTGKIVLSTFLDRSETVSGNATLRPDEGIVVKVS